MSWSDTVPFSSSLPLKLAIVQLSSSTVARYCSRSHTNLEHTGLTMNYGRLKITQIFNYTKCAMVTLTDKTNMDFQVRLLEDETVCSAGKSF